MEQDPNDTMTRRTEPGGGYSSWREPREGADTIYSSREGLGVQERGEKTGSGFGDTGATTDLCHVEEGSPLEVVAAQAESDKDVESSGQARGRARVE